MRCFLAWDIQGNCSKTYFHVISSEILLWHQQRNLIASVHFLNWKGYTAPNNHNWLLSHHNWYQSWCWLVNWAVGLKSKCRFCSGGGGKDSTTARKVTVLQSPPPQPMKYSVKLSADSLGAELGPRLQTKQILKEVHYKWNNKKRNRLHGLQQIHMLSAQSLVLTK